MDYASTFSACLPKALETTTWGGELQRFPDAIDPMAFQAAFNASVTAGG
jgi:hypothetical protein